MNQISRRSIVGGALLLPFAAVGIRAATAHNQASTPEASPRASPEASPSASPMASPAAGGEEIVLIAKDIMYDKTELEGPADTDITVTLKNEGVLEHDFAIEELDIVTDLLKPGETGSVTINAPAGEYEYWCTVAGHKESGMKGTLTLA